MKTNPDHRPYRTPENRRPPARRRSQGGFAVLVIMILLVIMVSLSMGNNIALARLQSDLQLVERRQQLRLSHPPPVAGAARTNAPPRVAKHPTTATGIQPAP